MRFAVLIYENQQDFASRTDPARQEAYWGAHAAYVKALTEAGVFVSGTGLLPPDGATSLRLKGGKRQVQDGPFADTKEQLGGLIVIDVPDLDAALSWAAKCPSAPTGGVEVRATMGCSNDSCGSH